MSRLAAALRNPRAALVASSLSLCFLTAETAGALPGDPSRADLLVAQGASLLEAGRIVEAQGYAARSLEFDETSPDAHALLGRIWLAEGRYDRGALEFGRALASGGFRVSLEADSRKALAGALLRLRRYGEVAEVLARVGLGDIDETCLLLDARAALRRGDIEEARGKAREASRRYPDSAEAYILVSDIERHDNRFGEARKVLETARARLPADPSVMVALLRDARVGEGRETLVPAYFALSARRPETDAAAAVAAMRLDPGAAGSYLDGFLAAGGAGNLEQLEAVRSLLAGAGDAVAKLDGALATWTGVRLSDTDGDGFPDHRYRLEQGALVEWGVDDNQDGLEELQVTMGKDGVPLRVTFQEWAGRSDPQKELGEALTLEYAGYPWVRRALYRQSARRREYELDPEAYRFRVLRAGRPATSPLLPSDFGAPREADIRGASWRCSDYLLPQELLLARCQLSGGAIVRVDADTDGDGRMDHIVLYREGLPVEGKRDLDEDGTYETHEEYVDGILVRIEIDADGDGKPEYVRSYIGGGSEAWDLDSDGTLDVERARGVTRELRAALSSAAGGVR